MLQLWRGPGEKLQVSTQPIFPVLRYSLETSGEIGGDKVREVLAINEILIAGWYSVGASWMGSSFPNGLFGVSENGKTGCSFFSRIQQNVTV